MSKTISAVVFISALFFGSFFGCGYAQPERAMRHSTVQGPAVDTEVPSMVAEVMIEV